MTQPEEATCFESERSSGFFKLTDVFLGYRTCNCI